MAQGEIFFILFTQDRRESIPYISVKLDQASDSWPQSPRTDPIVPMHFVIWSEFVMYKERNSEICTAVANPNRNVLFLIKASREAMDNNSSYIFYSGCHGEVVGDCRALQLKGILCQLNNWNNLWFNLSLQAPQMEASTSDIVCHCGRCSMGPQDHLGRCTGKPYLP